MSGAADIVAKLRGALADAYAGTAQAGGDYNRANKAAIAEDDIERSFRAAASAILAVEHLEEQAKRAARDLRMCLNAMLQDAGCHSTGDANITVSLAKKPAFLSIEDEHRIPRQFFVTLPPQLDKDRLKQALKGGVDVSGASMVTPNEMQLRIAVKAKE